MHPETPLLVKNLIANLRPTGWYDLLKVFLVSSDFSDIVDQLVDQVKDDVRFTPPLKQVFAPFQHCPLDSLEVVILAQGPYQRLGIADGLALSSSSTETPEELQRILDAIQLEFEHKSTGKPSLKRWAQQGVLLLNQSLTTQLDREAKHLELWNPFFRYLLDRLPHRNERTPWVLYGRPTWPLLEEFKHVRHVFLADDAKHLAQTLRLVNTDLHDQGRPLIKW